MKPENRSPRDPASHPGNLRHGLAALAAGLLTLIFTGLVALWDVWEARSAFRREFASVAAERSAEIETLFRITVARQQDIGALFVASRAVEAHEFSAFVEHSQQNSLFPYLSIAFIVPVPQAERSAFEQSLAQDYGPEFGRIRELSPDGIERPAGARPLYYSIRFAEPPVARNSEPGVDFNNKASLDALTKAITTGRTTLADSIADPPSDGDRTFRLFAPIFKETKASPRSLLGISSGVYSYGAMMGAAIREVTHFGQHIYAYASDDDDAKPVYIRRSRRPNTSMAPQLLRGEIRRLTDAIEYRIALADEVLTLVFVPAQPMGLTAFLGHRAGIIAFTGTLFAVMFASIAYTLSTARAERLAAAERSRLAAAVFHHVHEGILITDANADIIDVNRTFSDMTGYAKQEVEGRNPSLLKSGFHDRSFFVALWHSLLSKGYWRGEIWNRRKDGKLFAVLTTISSIKNDRGLTLNYIGLFSDITERKQREEMLRHLALFDPLTDLANRVLIHDRLHQGLARAKRRNSHVAVCYLDLDGFKPINDQYGHEAGDVLLRTIGQRLSSSAREHDTVGRLGGDEFVMVLTDLKAPVECEAILQRLMATISRECSLPCGAVVNVAASMGVTLCPPDEANADTLLRHADQAMYEAKRLGRNRIHWFDPAA